MPVTLKVGRNRVAIEDLTPGSFAEGQVRRATEEWIEEKVGRGLSEQVVLATPGLLRDLARRIKQRANVEAYRLIDYAIKIIEHNDRQKSGAGFSGAQISAYDELSQDGQVSWIPLSKSWQIEKGNPFKSNRFRNRFVSHKPQNAQAFFRYTDRLVDTLVARGYGYIDRRYGGVQVQIEETEAAQGRRVNLLNYAGRTKRKSIDVKPNNEDVKITLGKIHVHIFPKLSVALLPGLSSRRWTQTSPGGFERQVLGDIEVAKKLEGPRNRKRPLLQPLTQFWILYRIPREVQDTVQAWLKSNRNFTEGQARD